MATQVLPQVRVFQEFNLLPTAIVDPLRAFVFGPNYQVRTYEKAKSLIGLGVYDELNDVTYPYPSREAGELVDQDFSKLFIDNAKIRYWQDTDAAAVTFSPASPNYIDADGTFSFATTDTAARSSSLVKDVVAGDKVLVKNPNDISDTLLTSVRQVVREVVAGSFSAGTADADNATATTAAAVAVSAPTSNYSASIDASVYDGTVDGNLTDRYTIQISKSGGVGVAEFNLLSDSGLDDEFGIQISALGTPISVGDRGLTVTFDGAAETSSSSSSADGFSSLNDFQVGQTWVFDISGDYTVASTPYVNVSQAYTGPKNATYVLEVVSGGDSPRIAFRTTTGVDAGELDLTLDTLTTIGQYGLQVAFGPGYDADDGTSSSSSNASSLGYRLVKGDVFYAVATAPAEGRAYRLVLADTLPSTMLSEADLGLDIYSVQNIEVTEKRYLASGVLNFTQDSNEVEIASGITYFGTVGDPLNGSPVVGGNLYFSYRALSQDWVSQLQSVSNVSELGNFFTDLTPDNPLGFAVKKAVENSNGTAVRFIGVSTNDVLGYTKAVNKTLEREDVYSFVPLSQDPAVLNMVAGHVEGLSSPEKGRWRIAWVSTPVVDTLMITGNPTTPILATIQDNVGDAAGTNLLVTAAGAEFITDGVLAGDELRFNFGVDSFGETTYATAVVDQVVSETQVLLLTGPSSAVNVASQIEVWRTLDTDAQVTQLVADNSFTSRRIYNVFSGGATIDGFVSVEDFYLAAAYAGLRSGVAPHQGLTNVELGGVEAVPFMTISLNGNQLDTLANAGLWLTYQDPVDGSIYCRKQISTDLTDLNTTEQSITTNLDSQSYYYKNVLKPYIGRTNNVQAVHNLIRADLEAAFEFFLNNGRTPTLGGQLVAATIVELRPSVVERDKLVVTVSLDLPYPINLIDLQLVV